MRKAFTIYEAILVVVIVGILSAIAIPRLETDRLQEATDKLITALRYTQHLALIDDKYVPNENFSTYTNSVQKEKETKFWFKKWWVFYIRDLNGNTVTADPLTGPDIVIFSDAPSISNNKKFNRNPSKQEIAIDPQTGRLICGHKYDSGFSDEDIDRSYNLHGYGIKKVVITSECSSKGKILFDDIGRPHCIKPDNDSSLNPYDHIVKNQIKIKLCMDYSCINNSLVCIEPITGYVHLCGNN